MSQVGSTTTTINIDGVDKRWLFRKLWRYAQPTAFFETNDVERPEYEEPSDSTLSHYVENYCGRIMGVNLGGNEVDVRLYDETNGDGVFMDVVERVRARMIKPRLCENCATNTHTNKICSRCKCAYYCNTHCQRAHWQTHKEFCVQRMQVEALEQSSDSSESVEDGTT